jgi:hypothetical protein
MGGQRRSRGALINSARLIFGRAVFLQSVDPDHLQAMVQIFIVPCLNWFYYFYIARMENEKSFSASRHYPMGEIVSSENRSGRKINF